MKTIEGASLEICPGERAILYVPIPPDTDVEALDVDPATAARFRIVRADFISRDACHRETGVPGPAVRLEVENVGPAPAPARVFVDVEIARGPEQARLERAAEEWNRQAHDLRAAPDEAARARLVAEILAGRQRRGQA